MIIISITIYSTNIYIYYIISITIVQSYTGNRGIVTSAKNE